MPALDSDKVDKSLRKKLAAQVDEDVHDKYYLILDEEGHEIASTSISHGPKYTISDRLVTLMARQLCLGKTKNFVNLVRCPLSGDEALKIIKEHCSTGDQRRRH